MFSPRAPKSRQISPEWLFLALLIVLSAPAMAQSPDLSNIVDRMGQAQLEARARRQAYSSTRVYKIFESGNAPKSQIEASINFLPPGQKSYAIAKSTGGVAEHVVRKALDKEMELTKTPELTEISPANYNFEMLGERNWDGARCYLLGITPKRESKDLIKGQIWVDAGTFLVRHVEGSPEKSPSFWVHNVQMSFTFGEVAGMWLQRESTATARVRFAGEYVLRSQDTDVRTAETMAEATGAGDVTDPQNSMRHRHYRQHTVKP